MCLSILAAIIPVTLLFSSHLLFFLRLAVGFSYSALHGEIMQFDVQPLHGVIRSGDSGIERGLGIESAGVEPFPAQMQKPKCVANFPGAIEGV